MFVALCSKNKNHLHNKATCCEVALSMHSYVFLMRLINGNGLRIFIKQDAVRT